MRYSKWLQKTIIITVASLLTCAVAQAQLVVIGSQDIKINHLTTTQLAGIYLGKHVSLSTHEDLNPIDQNTGSKIYSQFYSKIADMDTSSVDSYWSGLVFSGESSRPPEVEGDRSAIASVENSHKAIAYVDSSSIGTQIANVKVLYGSVPQSQQASSYNGPVDLSPRTKESSQDDAKQQARLAKEIAALKLQQQQYQAGHGSTQKESDWESRLRAVSNDQGRVIVPVNAPGARKNLWSTMRHHFMLTNQAAAHQADVAKQLHWFEKNKWAVNTMLKNAEPYIAYVYQQTQNRGMPAEFALLPMVESGYVPEAHSHAGADGLWQFMSRTAKGKGLHIDWWYDGRRDFVSSTRVALDYLVSLHSNFNSWSLAAAAYNAGGGTIDEAMKQNARDGLKTDYWALHLPQETENYVPKLLALSMIIDDPQKYGFKLPALTTKPNVATITLHSQVDLAQAAQLSGVSRDEIKELNPGMLRWATYPNRPYNLVIPANKLQTFKVNLARLGDDQRLTWQYHEVGSNESLASIAKKYNVNLAMLEKINNLHSSYVAYGQGVLVPKVSNHTYADFAVNNQVTKSQVYIADYLKHESAGTTTSHPTMLAENKTATAEVSTSSSKTNSDSLKSLMSKLYN